MTPIPIQMIFICYNRLELQTFFLTFLSALPSHQDIRQLPFCM